jgi:MFS family permease
MICECLTLLAISQGYEKISRHWLWIQLYGVIATIISLLVQLFLIPESPKFLYLAKRYKESKQVLAYMSRFNQRPPEPFMFNKEFLSKNKNKGDEEPLIQSAVQKTMHGQEMSDSDYEWNLFKMVFIWTMTIFSSNLIMLQLKYLRGNIFDNTNSFAISDALSRVFGGLVYSTYGIQKSFLTAFGIAIVGGIGIYLVQSNNPVVTDFPFFKS